MTLQTLSAYEEQRNQNVLNNNAKLRELGLLDSEPSNVLLGLEPTQERPSKKRKERSLQPVEPQRRSSRKRQEAPVDVFIAEEDDSGRVVVGGTDAASDCSKTAKVDLSNPDELPITVDDLRETERQVYEALRAARNAKARAMERSMFIVCNDRTLCEMVRLVPAALDLSLIHI